MKIFKNILCILFALLFINAGLDKLFHYMPTPPMDRMVNATSRNYRTPEWFTVYFSKDKNFRCISHLSNTHWHFYPQYDFLQPTGINYLGRTFHYMAMGGI